jgi:hypothetical protein
MRGEHMAERTESDTPSSGQSAIALAFVLLVAVSLIAALYFVSISAASLLTQSVNHSWSWCFFVCSTALAGWMILYGCQLRLGSGGVMVFLNNLLLFWFLVFAVFVTGSLGFVGPQRYIAILSWAVSLAAFHIAVVPGFLNPQRLVWLILKKRNKGSRAIHSGPMPD